MYSISRERVRQIVRRAGFTREESLAATREGKRERKYLKTPCIACGETIYHTGHRNRLFCNRACIRAWSDKQPVKLHWNAQQGHWFGKCPLTGKHLRAARIIAQHMLGRALERNEWVSLKDGDPNNLEDSNILIGKPREVRRHIMEKRREAA